MTRLLAVALTLVCATPALARHHSRHHEIASQNIITCNRFGCRGTIKATMHVERRHHATRHEIHAARTETSDPRPYAWCAWWLRRNLGIPKSAFHPYEWNLARAFRYIGQRAAGPAVGVIVVWNHHVGVITGHNSDGWIVKSGNDGHAVRERPRSLRGVIAFRWPPNRWAAL